MFRYPLSDAGMKAALIAIPIVFILVWLFNSYKLGMFGNKRFRTIILLVGAAAVLLAAVVARMVIRM